MRLPKKILIIGAAIEIVYSKSGGKKKMVKNFDAEKMSYLIACNSTCTALFIFPANPVGTKKIIRDTSGPQSGMMHTEIKYEIPTNELKKIGGVCEVRYASDWWEGKMTEYRHKFKTEPAMHANQYTHFDVVGIKPKSGKILTDRGIVQ